MLYTYEQFEYQYIKDAMQGDVDKLYEVLRGDGSAIQEAYEDYLEEQA